LSLNATDAGDAPGLPAPDAFCDATGPRSRIGTTIIARRTRDLGSEDYDEQEDRQEVRWRNYALGGAKAVISGPFTLVPAASRL
jgi:hypothetical protein